MTDRARLCASPRCWRRDQHWDDCNGGNCRGCLPRQAASDSRLCEACRRQLADHIAALPQLHADLGQILTHGTRGGERGSNKPGSRMPSPAAMDARERIRHLLASWAQMVCEELGVMTPINSVGHIADFLGKHVVWLAAHGAAADCADEFAGAVVDARRIAYPNGAARTFDVADCPMECEGVIRAVLRRADSLLPSELVCDINPEHTWSSTQWMKLGRQIIKAAA